MAATWLLQSTFARAEPADPPWRLVYTAPAGCPGEVTFRSQVSARTSRIRFVKPGDATPGPRFILEVDRSAATSHGRLTSELLTGERSVRDVEAETCDEVIAALALVAVLTIDPDAGAAPEASTRESPPQSSRFWLAAVGASAGASSLFGSPSWLFSGSADIGRGLQQWDYLFRFTIAHAEGATSEVRDMRASFARTSLGALFCPFLPLGAPLELAPCIGAQGGMLQARAEHVDNGQVERRLWMAIDAAAQGRVALSRGVFLEAIVSVPFALTRDHFRVAPDTLLYSTPVLSVEGSLGAGFRWP